MNFSFRIKPIEVIFLLLVIIGFYMRYTHFAAGSFLSLVVAMAFMMYYIIDIIVSAAKDQIRNDKSVLPSFLLGFAGAWWMLYITFSLLFLPAASWQLIGIIPLSIAGVAMLIYRRQTRIVSLCIFLFALAAGILVLKTPTHKLYRFLTFNASTMSEEEYPARYWDRYSWFLYQDNEYEKALEANTKAQQSVRSGSKINVIAPQGDTTDMLNHLQNTREQIENHTWDTYSNEPYRKR